MRMVSDRMMNRCPVNHLVVDMRLGGSRSCCGQKRTRGKRKDKYSYRNRSNFKSHIKPSSTENPYSASKYKIGTMDTSHETYLYL